MTKKPAVKKSHAAPVKEKAERYFEAIGRRKTAVARVRVYKGSSVSGKKADVIVNEKPVQEYFAIRREVGAVSAPFEAVSEHYKTSVKVEGGGSHSQAEAIRLGVSRALVLIKPEWRSRLKALGFLKRDPRMVERKKYGSRKARRPQQWRKR